MYRGEVSEPENLVARSIPLVLAIASHGPDLVRERLLLALGLYAVRRSGRVLVLECAKQGAGISSRLDTQKLDSEQAFAGDLLQGPEGIHFAAFEGNPEICRSELFATLDAITGTPPRYDLVLLNIAGGSPEEAFVASLAQRVLLVTAAEPEALVAVRAQMTKLSTQHQQRHFTLAVTGPAEAAREVYRTVLGHAPELSQVECNLIEELPKELLGQSELLKELPSDDTIHELLLEMGGGILPEVPVGRLQLFWRSLLLCGDCSLNLCREFLAAGQNLEACPVRRY